jgi:hypothetical protein
VTIPSTRLGEQTLTPYATVHVIDSDNLPAPNSNKSLQNTEQIISRAMCSVQPQSDDFLENTKCYLSFDPKVIIVCGRSDKFVAFREQSETTTRDA